MRFRYAVGCAALALACTYDFDDFVSDEAISAGGQGGTAGDGRGGASGASGSKSSGGTAATPSAAGEGGDAAELGGGGTGGEPVAEAGSRADGGFGGDAGEGGATSPSGGSTAKGGTPANGGSTGGTTAGGSKSSGGEGGAGGFDCAAVSGTVWNGRCYFSIGGAVGVTWSQARTDCAGYSASTHLVTIGSVEEQEFLEATFFPSDVDHWIGLSLADVANNPPAMCRTMPGSCPFVWVTGEALSYTKWGSHSANDLEPNYSGACVRIERATLDWADLDCAPTRLPAICESE